MRRMFALTGLVVLIVCAAASRASAATITVAPSSTPSAGTVTVAGDVLVNGTRGCAVGDDVTLISNAFTGLGDFAGQGAVVLPVDSTGHFSQSVTLKSSVAAGTYQITGRCGGGNLGVTATLTVSGLPRTGGSFGPFTTAEVFALALALCFGGAALARTGRRREAAISAGGTDRV
jgi:hypothetical protein